MKVYKVVNCDALGEWDFKRLRQYRPNADILVYNYIDQGYEGTGFALWREGNKFGYAYLGHCSCNGPFEDVDSILYSMPQIKKLSKINNYEWQYSPKVIEKMLAILEKQK